MHHQHHGDELGFLLAQVCKLHHGRVRALFQALGLYRGQPPLLRALWERDGLTHSELAERLHVQPATVTKMVQRMARVGFVESRPDPEDQRVSRVYLEEAGRAVREDVHLVERRLDEEAFGGFSAQERELLRGLLSRIRENLLAAAREEDGTDTEDERD